MMKCIDKFPIKSDRIECSLLVEYDLTWYINNLKEDYISEFLEYKRPKTDGWEKQLYNSLLFNINELKSSKFNMGIATIRTILKLHNGTRIGALSIIGITDDAAFKMPEIAYWMNREYSGKGYCKEAVEAVIRAFSNRHFTVEIDSENYKSINLIKSCGFRKISNRNSITNDRNILIFCNS